MGVFILEKEGEVNFLGLCSEEKGLYTVVISSFNFASYYVELTRFKDFFKVKSALFLSNRPLVCSDFTLLAIITRKINVEQSGSDGKNSFRKAKQGN